MQVVLVLVGDKNSPSTIRVIPTYVDLPYEPPSRAPGLGLRVHMLARGGCKRWAMSLTTSTAEHRATHFEKGFTGSGRYEATLL